ncbi:UNVERIFIED_CONTAM: hypothetical protein RKD50_009600 [Streptomyces canus]
MRLPRPLPTVPLTAVSALLLTGCLAVGGSGNSGGSATGDKRVRVVRMQPPRSGLSPLSDDAFKLALEHRRDLDHT